jgi:predicted nuclease with TOPRIM domain
MNLPDYSILKAITDLDLQSQELANLIKQKQESLEVIKGNYEQTLKEDEVLIKDRITIKIKRKAISDHIQTLKSQEQKLKKQIEQKLSKIFKDKDPKRAKALETISKSVYSNY